MLVGKKSMSKEEGNEQWKEMREEKTMEGI